MQVGIVGSGKVGRALGSWLAKVGFTVLFTSRDPKHAEEAAQAAGNGAAAAPINDLVRKSQVILLTLPFQEIVKTLEPVSDALAGKTVVDVSNPITPDHKALVLGHTTSGVEEISKKFKAARLVKAFNAVFAEVYASQQPEIGGHTISIFFAGDDSDAKAEVRKLITRLGFDPVDAGPLVNARYLEPLSLLNIQLGRVLGYGTEIGFSLLRK